MTSFDPIETASCCSLTPPSSFLLLLQKSIRLHNGQAIFIKKTIYQSLVQTMSFTYMWQEHKDLSSFVSMEVASLASRFLLWQSKIKEKARVVAMDLRGHGKSVSENELDLSLETMSNDFLAVIKELYGDSPPAIVLVGHRWEVQSQRKLLQTKHCLAWLGLSLWMLMRVLLLPR